MNANTIILLGDQVIQIENIENISLEQANYLMVLHDYGQPMVFFVSNSLFCEYWIYMDARYYRLYF